MNLKEDPLTLLSFIGTADPLAITITELQAADVLSDPISLVDGQVLYERVILQIVGTGLTGGDATSGVEVRACCGFTAADNFQFSGNNLLFVGTIGEAVMAASVAFSNIVAAANSRVCVVGARSNGGNTPYHATCPVPYIKVRFDALGTAYTGGTWTVHVLRGTR